MEIKWYGHSCFRLASASGTVVTDPFRESAVGLADPSVEADIVTVSHDHPGHNHVAAVQGSPFVISGPGEYEVKGCFVTGVRMAHDAVQGTERGLNTAYCVQADGISVCHLGDLGHVPDQAQVEALGAVDVLLLPVGGRHTIGASEAAEIINLIDPSIAVPMHYRSPGRPDIDPLEKFLGEMGVGRPEPLSELSVTEVRLPDERQIVLLALPS